MKKHMFRWIIALAVVLPCLLVSASAANGSVIDSGSCGDNLAYTLYEDGELFIEGTGAITDYGSGSSAPWYSNRDRIKIVSIGDEVTSIGSFAFSELENLTDVTIPDSVIAIGQSAFSKCGKLETIAISDGIATIGSYAFYRCYKLASVTVPGSVTNIGVGVFQECTNLTTAVINDGVTFIGQNMFSGCALTSVIIPDSVISIGKSAFSACSLESVSIPQGVTTIGVGAFAGCRLTSITIPNSVTTIGDSAFTYCRLSRVEFLGDAPTTVGSSAFNNNLSDLTIYCHENTTGWLESEYYDAETGIWCGYPLIMLEAQKPTGTITDTGRSISLQDQIYINQYVTVSGFDDIDVASNGGLLIWNNSVTETEALYGTADTTQKGLISYEGEYTQRTLGISAKNYADEVYLRVYIEIADGEYVYGPLVEYSVQDYCEHKIATDDYSAELKQTCAALLHYGAMAQCYFNYNTADLANANILDVYPAPAWMTED